MPHSVNNSTSTQTKMSCPSSTSTQSANVFPKQAGAQLLSPDVAADQLVSPSPSQTQFSFVSSPRSCQESDETDATRYSRGTAGDGLGELRPATSRARAQYYEDSFQYKDGTSSARDRVTKDAPIVAELRTNVIIKDEYTLVTDLSHHVSTRYQRPEASIMITVNHSACLLLGGSFEPTYILTINALPVQLQPTTNKRNAALMQQFMCESIGVTPERGIIKFVAFQEENFATNGTTILGEIERLERKHAEENGTSMKRGITKASRKSAVSKAKSSIQLSRNTSKANTDTRAVVTPPLPGDGPLDSGVAMNEKGLSTSSQPVDTTMSYKKSELLLSRFGHSRSTSKIHLPPPIPKDAPDQQIKPKKSFMHVFRR